MTLGDFAALSDTGRKRRRNEDAYLLEPPLFAVADGMGGAQAGEIASRLAASAVREGEPEQTAPEQRVVALIQEANRRVYEHAGESTSMHGMGTTITLALAGEDSVVIGHVGDSRAYRLREGELEQLTEDHSLVAELVRSGRLSPEEAETHPQRSVITRALGTDPDVDVDVLRVPTRSGDVFLLCSDGLTTMLGADTIRETIERDREDLERAARDLVSEANRRGGEDNITVVLFEIATSGATATEIRRAPTGDEAETLTEVSAVPTVVAEPVPEPVAVQVADGAEPARRRRRVRPLPVIIMLALLAAVAGGAAWTLSWTHFVGADSDGYVAIYQGLPYDLGGGIHLYRRVAVTSLRVELLTRQERRRLLGHDLTSGASAKRQVRQTEQAVVAP
ncbi:MAG: Stp1/IreP family PP2C-type Ser/Thr phosphatase [Gaiellaceae bacterium]